MISNDLIKEILNYDGSFGDYTTEQIMEDEWPTSKYELANKCKEWALNQGYQFRTTQLFDTFYLEFGKQGNGFPIDIKHEGMEQPNDYFDMCQWILNDKAKK